VSRLVGDYGKQPGFKGELALQQIVVRVRTVQTLRSGVRVSDVVRWGAEKSRDVEEWMVYQRVWIGTEPKPLFLWGFLKPEENIMTLGRWVEQKREERVLMKERLRQRKEELWREQHGSHEFVDKLTKGQA
jgi:hypothetical protein